MCNVFRMPILTSLNPIDSCCEAKQQKHPKGIAKKLAKHILKKTLLAYEDNNARQT